MSTIPAHARRLTKARDIGQLVANGRKRLKLSQTAFAQQLGVSRKTLSDLERGLAEHLSVSTAMKALQLAGYTLEASQRRLPTLPEIMAHRAQILTREDDRSRNAGRKER